MNLIVRIFFSVLSIMQCCHMHGQQSLVKPSSFYSIPARSSAVWDALVDKINTGVPIGLADIPGFEALAFNQAVKDFLNKIQIYKPWPEVYEFGVALKGKVDLFGTPINTMLYFAHDIPGHISFYVAIPPVFKFETIAPEFKILDSLFPQYRIFALSLTDYYFDAFGIRIGAGLTMLSSIALGYPFDVIGASIGTRMNELEIAGTIAPRLAGSIMTTTFPGKLDFGGIKTTGLALQLSLEEVQPSVIEPRFAIETGFSVYWPALFSEPQLFKGAIKVSPIKGEVYGKTKGNLPIPGLPGSIVSLREIALSASLDWGLLAASAGTVPLSGVGFGALVDVSAEDKSQKKTFGGVIKAEYSSAGVLGDFILSASMQGQLALEEVIDFGARQLFELSKLTGSELDLRPLYKNKNTIPRIIIADPFLEVIPKTVSFAGNVYNARIAYGGSFALLDTIGFVNFHMSLEEGIRGQGYLSNVHIGPLKITGYLPEEKGPRVDFRLNLLEQFYYLSGRLELDILGGIHSETLIALSLAGLICTSRTRLFNKFDAQLEIKASLLDKLSADNFYCIGKLEQNALSALALEIKGGVRKLVPDFDEKAQAEFDRVAAEIKRLEEERDKEYAICMGPGWDWSHARCRLFWGEILSRQAKIDGLVVYRDAILKPGVTIARGVLSATSSVTEFGAEVLAKGLNIESFVFEGRLTEFVGEGKLPKISMVVHFLGRTLLLKDMQFSFKDTVGSANLILQKLRDAWHQTVNIPEEEMNRIRKTRDGFSDMPGGIA